MAGYQRYTARILPIRILYSPNQVKDQYSVRCFSSFRERLPNIAKLTANLFADDIKVYCLIKSKEDCELLQTNLKCLSAWSKTWFINFNALKCVVLRKRETIKYIYTLDGVEIESVTEQKDLGITASNNLKPTAHIDAITKKAYHKTGLIKRCFKNYTPEKISILDNDQTRIGIPSMEPLTLSDKEKPEKAQRKCRKLIQNSCI